MTEYVSWLDFRQIEIAGGTWSAGWWNDHEIPDVVLGCLLSNNRVLTGCLIEHYPTAAGPGVRITAGSVYKSGQYVDLPETLLSVEVSVADGAIIKNWITVDDTDSIVASTDLPTSDCVPLAVAAANKRGGYRIIDLRCMGYGDPERPRQIGTDFVFADLDNGILTFSHGLGVDFPSAVTVWDDNKKRIQPSDVTSVDPNNIAVDLSAFGTITGTWHITVRS